MNCEICGSEGVLFKTLIEGSELKVCRECSKYGKVISPVETETEKKQRKEYRVTTFPEKELVQVIVQDYPEKIRKKREELGLKQEEFAKKINEKESMIHKIETGQFEPGIMLARKIEKFLRISLVEQYEEEHKTPEKSKTTTFTIGDLIKIKK